MKLQQLRYIWEVAHHDLNVSATAQSLYTSQPGISKQIRLLEDELGVEIFARSGKHLTHITPAGEDIIKAAEEVLFKVKSIRQVAEEYADEKKGSLSIATTHTQARYALPPTIKAFVQKCPDVSLHMHQGTPLQISEMASDGSVDFAIATEALELFANLIMMPCYRWNRCLIAPRDHPLLAVRPISLELLGDQPLVTYVLGFTGRGHFSDALAREGLKPRVTVSAADADVIKTYVREGFGIGIIADLAYDPHLDTDLGRRDLSHLFPWEVTRMAQARSKYPRTFQRAFMELFQREAATLVRERQRGE